MMRKVVALCNTISNSAVHTPGDIHMVTLKIVVYIVVSIFVGLF
ncbi:MAG TPA: hypothetical protein DC064_23960, partial [Cyanobacteria bacterium UBA9273]|nr:hypothetical protein [Cyanobacteria bacterium UBA9273]